MRYPHEDFKTKFNTTAGYGFGAKTVYGYHEAQDINGNGGGNSDLDLPIYAIADGEVTSIHNHKTNFGNHLHYKIDGAWGTRWVHNAHMNKINVVEGQFIREGQLIGTIGNSGTVYAHNHFAIKNKPTGIDAIAKTKEELKSWEDPIAFIEKWMNHATIAQPITQQLTDDEKRANEVLNTAFLTLKTPENTPYGNKEGMIALVEMPTRIANLEKEKSDLETRLSALKTKHEKCFTPTLANFSKRQLFLELLQRILG